VTDGYVADVPYVRSFTREQVPAWLDHVALVSGFSPPERGQGFAYCDIGCGHGFTTSVIAATHPDGVFHGIDANPAHIESAHRFAAEARISNVTWHATDFAQAAGFDLPAFDYIVSHGVYSWVNEDARQAWRRFVARHLKPGGILHVSYNAMPGRSSDLPFQKLVHSLGRAAKGNSHQQVLTAIEIAVSMMEMKVPALVASPMAGRIRESMSRLSPGYLTHELMCANWEPLCVNDVRAALAPIGLKPAGSANLMENYDSFVLGRAARATLATIQDPDVRELARDFFIDQFFRHDVFIRDGKRVDDDTRRSSLLESTWSLARPAASIEYHVQTPAGRLNFDNPVSRHIVAALSPGPRRLVEITNDSIPSKDLIANVLALSAADAIWPVEANCASVTSINDAIFKRADGPDEIRYVALPFGTAVPASRELLASLKAGVSPMNDEFGSWIASQLSGLRQPSLP